MGVRPANPEWIPIPPICRLVIDRPEVVLTFDDGPSAYTPGFAAVLREEKVPAAFFWRADETRHGLVGAGRLVQEGHQIGSHSVMHRHLTALSDNELNWEIERAGRVLSAKGGVPIRHFRPPYGEYDVRTLICARACGMAVVLWDVDTLDWQRAETPQRIVEAAMQARPGSIILMHERPQTLKVLRDVIGRLRSAGFGFRLLPDPAENGPASA